MKKLIKFIEKYSIDKSFYCRVNDIYSRDEWEISWNKGGAENVGWGLKAADEADWTYYSGEKFIDMVSFYKIDVIALELELQAKVKNMIVFVNLMLKEAKKLMGEDIVEVSLAEYDEFAQSLMETIKKLLPDQKYSPSKESESVAQSLPRSSLRLVRPESDTSNSPS